jgi:flavin reductase (DIM6/NTAB) family NADH-FMN oxidoreductase RutF
MEFDLTALAASQRYKLLAGLIVPRPIALVTSRNASGAVNAAPFSFFNLMGSDPPVVVLGIGRRSSGELKDTVRNILDVPEFTVNLVNEALAEAMNVCAIDLPAGVSELEASGLTPARSAQISVPYIAQAPASLECHLNQKVEIGSNIVLLGEVVHLHLRDELFDAEKFYVHTDRLHAIGRMHGGGWYTRTRDLFDMPRFASLDEVPQKP